MSFPPSPCWVLAFNSFQAVFEKDCFLDAKVSYCSLNVCDVCCLLEKASYRSASGISNMTATRQFNGSRFENFGTGWWRLMNLSYFYRVLLPRPFGVLIFEPNYTVGYFFFWVERVLMGNFSHLSVKNVLESVATL